MPLRPALRFCLCHAVPPPSPVLADPVIRSGLANFHFAICELCLDDTVQDRIRRPRETRWPGANIRRFVLARLPFCFVQVLVCNFSTISLARGQDRGCPTRSPSWLDLGLWALGSVICCCVESGPPWLASPHEGAVANPQLFRLQYFSLRFHSAAAHLPRTLARHPIRPTCCPMRRIHHGIRR